MTRALRVLPALRAAVPTHRVAIQTPPSATRPERRIPDAAKAGPPACGVLPETTRAVAALLPQEAAIRVGRAVRQATAVEQKSERIICVSAE